MRVLTRENLLDILYGCTILGTGGGGSLNEGIEMIDEAGNNTFCFSGIGNNNESLWGIHYLQTEGQ